MITLLRQRSYAILIRFKVKHNLTLLIVTFVSGYWLMHCHLAHHQSDGMNLVMQEGEIQEMAALPPNFPTCNNFRVNPNQFLSSLKHQERMLSSKG